MTDKCAADALNGLREPFYRDDLVTILHADSTHLAPLTDESIDLVVTSPPYNLDITYDGYGDALPYNRYLHWVGTWASALLRVARPGGRACVNIPLDSNKGGKHAMYADYVQIFREAGWTYQTTIVWNEQNLSRRTAWGSWMSPTAPFVTAPVEMVAIFHKGPWRRDRHGRRGDVTRDEFLDWTLGVWQFPGESPKRVRHPAPFPPELPRRLIKLYSFVDDVILDPFLGSGTTVVVGKSLGRQCIGIDSSEEYCRTASFRCAREPAPRPSLTLVAQVEPLVLLPAQDLQVPEVEPEKSRGAMTNDKLEPAADRPPTGGFGSHEAKNTHQVVNKGHQHGQKVMPKRRRGAAVHHKDEQSRASNPEE